MNGDQRTPLLEQLLPPGDVPDQAVPDVVSYLASKYGEPKKTTAGPDTESLLFDLPDRKIYVYRTISTVDVVGGSILLQAAPPPCPTPGPTGATFTPLATGSDNFTFQPAAAAAIAFAKAAASFVANYGALRATMCGALCPPPCGCNTPLAGVPTITQVTTVARRLLGIPVRWTITVTINVTFSVVCV